MGKRGRVNGTYNSGAVGHKDKLVCPSRSSSRSSTHTHSSRTVHPTTSVQKSGRWWRCDLTVSECGKG